MMLSVVSLIGGQKDDAVIRNDLEGPYVDGSYRWALQTATSGWSYHYRPTVFTATDFTFRQCAINLIMEEGGIFHEQKGSFPPSEIEPNENSLLVEGQYQYTAPDGQIIHVLYKAGENGFQPTGDHIPTPPPVPEAIQRALDYVARLRASQQ